MKRISIIIPVYNTESYLRKCLGSCVKQGILSSDYEIIVVNDGSPDKSQLIIDEYVERYDNIISIKQENGGLSNARNAGFNIAKGEYVWFVDSDDMLADNSIHNILNTICEEEVDCILLGHVEEDEDNNVIHSYTYPKKSNIIGIDFLSNNQKDCEFFIPAQFTVWNRAFLRTNGFVFYPNIYHEDCEFTTKAISVADSIKCISGIQYRYIRHCNTISTTINSKRAYDYVKVAQSLFSFNKANSNCTTLYNYIALFVNCSVKIILKCKKDEIIKFQRYLKSHKSLLDILVKKCDGKYKISAFIIRALIKL